MQPIEGRKPELTLAAELTQEQKLLARQQCFYGCVFCGSPVFHYYLQPHSSAIALICPLHAKQLRSTLLSPSTLVERINQPFNQQRINKPGFSFDQRALLNPDFSYTWPNSSALVWRTIFVFENPRLLGAQLYMPVPHQWANSVFCAM